MNRFNLVHLLLNLPAVLIGLTIHELAHGAMAARLGDPTAKKDGRLTLNPIKHIDPIGFFLLLFVGFGWAKPVRMDPMNFKNPKNDIMAVALAGPFANFLLAVFSALTLKLLDIIFPGFVSAGPAAEVISEFFLTMIWINLVLSVFNMFPIPPLDGSVILMTVIPEKYASFKASYWRFGSILLLGMIVVGDIAGTDLLPIGSISRGMFNGLLKIIGL